MHEGPTPPRSEPGRGALPTLGVVMPAYNEGRWVVGAVDALLTAAARARWEPQVVVVDDGSTDPSSVEAMRELERIPGVRVLRQANAGRFAARSQGLAAVDTDYVLLLDARVEVASESLVRLRDAVHRGDRVWNFDVTPASRELSALFWTGITKVWWRDYFRDRRTVSFGVEDFDRFPKGTGAFFAPLPLLREAAGRFGSHFDDVALASDDTRLLRHVAQAERINLSPEIMCRHHAKSGGGSFARQCYYRGTTFVDGYLRDRAQARPLLAVALLAGATGLGLSVRAPRAVAATGVAGCAAAGSLTRWAGGTPRESVAVAVLSPVFGTCFGAGVLRGLRLAARARAHGHEAGPD